MSQHHFHAVVWIDHHEARVFHFSPTDVEKLIARWATKVKPEDPKIVSAIESALPAAPPRISSRE